MDVFKETINQVVRKNSENSQNTRRFSRNVPQIERKVDHIVFDKPFVMEFPLDTKDRSAIMNLYLRPPDTCFKCNAGISPTIDRLATCTANCGPILTGGELLYTSFGTNVGGFGLGDEGGIIVPRDAYYSVRISIGYLGVVTSEADGVVASVRHNGVVISQLAHTVANGKLPPPLAGTGGLFDFYGICIPIRGGDKVGGWIEGSLSGFNLNVCTIEITLVGLA